MEKRSEKNVVTLSLKSVLTIINVSQESEKKHINFKTPEQIGGSVFRDEVEKKIDVTRINLQLGRRYA